MRDETKRTEEMARVIRTSEQILNWAMNDEDTLRSVYNSLSKKQLVDKLTELTLALSIAVTVKHSEGGGDE